MKRLLSVIALVACTSACTTTDEIIIDKQGVVRHAFSSQLRVGKHVNDALEVVKSLS